MHVHQLSLDAAGVPLSRLEPLLTPDEAAWVRRLHFPADRSRYAIGRLRLRWVLAAHLGARPPGIRLRPGTHGKPVLAPPHDAEDLRFSASYSAGIALVAVTRGIEVGVDVERLRDDVDIEQVAASFFAPVEREQLRRLAPDLRRRAFFTCWTRKEAYLKALGVGLSVALDSFDVAVGLDGAPVPENWSIPGPGGPWSVRDLGVETGYAAALAVEGVPQGIPRVATPIDIPLEALLDCDGMR